MKIHYKHDPEKQEQYEKIVKSMTETLKERYGKGFDESVHPDMIEQYARSIIRSREIEERIDNGDADTMDYSNLKSERAVQKDLIDRLKLTVRGIVGDTRSFKKEKTQDFKEFLTRKLSPFIGCDDDETDRDTVQQE